MRLPWLVVALLVAVASRAPAQEATEPAPSMPEPPRTAESPKAAEPSASPRVEPEPKPAAEAHPRPAAVKPAAEEMRAPEKPEPKAVPLNPDPLVLPSGRKAHEPASARAPGVPLPPPPAQTPPPLVRFADAVPEGRPSDARGSGPDGLLAAAHELYTALLAKNVDRLAALSRAPFYFESRAASSPEEIKKRWASALSTQPLESLRLYDIEVLSPEDTVKKHGKPPERLSGWPLSGSTLTIGNLSGHAAVVLWRKSGNAWQAVAFHD